LVGAWISAFLAAQVAGATFFVTIRPDWSATDGEKVWPAWVVLTWAAIGVALALGTAAAFVAYRKARRGNVRSAFAWALAASLMPPVNPVILAGAIQLRRSRRATGPAREDVAPGRSGLLRAGMVALLVGAVLSAAGAVGTLVSGVGALLAGQTFAWAALAVLAPLSLLFAASAVAAFVGVREARRGRAEAAAGWALLSGFLPPVNPLLLLAAALCYGSRERQAAVPVPAQSP